MDRTGGKTCVANDRLDCTGAWKTLTAAVGRCEGVLHRCCHYLSVTFMRTCCRWHPGQTRPIGKPKGTTEQSTKTPDGQQWGFWRDLPTNKPWQTVRGRVVNKNGGLTKLGFQEWFGRVFFFFLLLDKTVYELENEKWPPHVDLSLIWRGRLSQLTKWTSFGRIMGSPGWKWCYKLELWVVFNKFSLSVLRRGSLWCIKKMLSGWLQAHLNGQGNKPLFCILCISHYPSFKSASALRKLTLGVHR